MTDILEYKFNNIWSVWSHLNNVTEWHLQSYVNITKIKDFVTMWQFLNNIHKLKKYKKLIFFITKNNIKPIWEDINNKNIKIFRITLFKVHDKINDITELIIYMLCLFFINKLFTKDIDINCISFGYKNKIYYNIEFWVNNNIETNNITDILTDEILNMLPEQRSYYCKVLNRN